MGLDISRTRIRNWSKAWWLWIAVIAAICLASVEWATATARVSRVLYISSYHLAFATVPKQIAGMREAFAKGGYDVSNMILDFEFMDTRRFPDAEHTAQFHEALAAKLAKLPAYDVVILGDDNALRYGLDHHVDLFRNTPLVFLGINNIALAQEQADDPLVTGVVEATSMAETLEAIERMLPNAEELIVVVGASETGQFNLAQFEQHRAVLKRLSVRIASLGDMTYEELYEAMKSVTDRSAILLFGAVRDKAGNTTPHLQVLQSIQENTTAPVFSLWDTGIGFGLVGGKIVSHEEHGRVAAEMAIRILNGEPASKIPVQMESPNVFLFEYGALVRHGIDLARLLAGSRVVNKPQSFRERYAHWIPWLVAFFVIQSAIIVVLVLSNRRRRIAEQRAVESEARFRDFAEASGDWMWEMDENLKFSYCGPSFFKLTGLRPDDLLGHDRTAATAPDEDLHSQKWLDHKKTLSERQPFRGFEYRVITPDGLGRIVSVNGNPIFDDNGAFKGYRGTATDITERHTSEQALNQALAMAERANRTKSEFLATMSHEFRTPLNAIIGFSDMMRTERLGKIENETYREYAEDIHHSGLLMTNLIGDILDISAIEAGKRHFAAEMVNVATVARDTARQIEPLARERGITFTIDAPDDLAPIIADTRSIIQIMLNLLSNAVKYTEPGGSVAFSVSQRDGRTFIVVRDTGIGIPADRLHQITEPFSQAHDNPHVAQVGTGLGLSIVSALVEAHDATLEIDSEPGTGTTVTVTFGGR